MQTQHYSRKEEFCPFLSVAACNISVVFFKEEERACVYARDNSDNYRAMSTGYQEKLWESFIHSIFHFKTFRGVHMKENEVNSEVDICDGRKGEMTSNGIQRKDKNRENEMTKDCNIDAPPSMKPAKKYSDISGLPANYTDPQTKLRFASTEEFSYIRQLPTDVVTGYLALRKATCIVP
ncbi:INO80 complex subunit C-like protein [Labeo rohita]|uniref:INO80 complex subunit C-like protein n=1 Tax=Labeo rohita TaxID=84645 RepID=A0A498NDK6_LABRO|nr:INO80 complex subunit C-like protein [Labeo rohita]